MNSTRTELIKSIHEVINHYSDGIGSPRFARTRAFLFAALGGPVGSTREHKRKVQQQTLDGISELSDADLVALHRSAVCDFYTCR